MSPNEYHENLSARKFWVRRGLHMAKVVGAPRIARLIGGEFCEKMKFVVFEMWGLERPTNVPKWIPWKSWWTNVLYSEGCAHSQGWRCTTSQVDGLVGSFVKKWNLWFLRCEGWKGLQMSANEYCKSLGAWKFWIGWMLHLAKLVGAPRHSYMAWWGVLWKSEIRGFWDVMVGKAYKCPQMNTMKFLVHEIFSSEGFAYGQGCRCTTA